MPTYAYRCRACGHEFDVFQSITARSKRKCPACEKNTLERLISGGGAVLFKGNGFYETDYRSSDYKKKAEAEKKAAEPKSDGKKEAKPGKKSDTTTAKSDKKKPAVKP